MFSDSYKLVLQLIQQITEAASTFSLSSCSTAQLRYYTVWG